MNIYADKSQYKVVVVLIALLIGSCSVFYTDLLVKQLDQRERQQIELFAKSMQFLVSGQDISEDINFVFQEINRANEIFPVILVDGKGEIQTHRNVPIPKAPPRNASRRSARRTRKHEGRPRAHRGQLRRRPGQLHLLQQLVPDHAVAVLPVHQLSVIGVFVLLGYLAFSYSRKAEQNRVWVGLAKETAHQLGTPLSSLMAWIEYFKADPRYADDEVIPELEKDVERLEMITARFSNIGSVPALKEENVLEVVQKTVLYLQKRISPKVHMHVTSESDELPGVLINKHLFEWVIENLCKNAVDAMSGSGEIRIHLRKSHQHKLLIDVTDNGKGISKKHITRVFEPGFSTKKRGWGLGLTLAKRIIENYHKGKIFVKQSEPGKGTTFRIIMNHVADDPAKPATHQEKTLKMEN
jgi:signal transduction histidine kinase